MPQRKGTESSLLIASRKFVRECVKEEMKLEKTEEDAEDVKEEDASNEEDAKEAPSSKKKRCIEFTKGMTVQVRLGHKIVQPR